jgi:pimeloyl-ACP methyl ester carboxylesterase/predicted amidohydrolase
MMMPSVQFCVSPHGRRLAYASLGEGPIVLCPPGWISHLGVLWDDAGFRRFITALAQHNRVVWFDRQGCGFSARDRTDYSLDEDVLDLETVAAELPEQPLSLFAISCTGPVAVVFAARHPERVARLMLYGTFARGERVATKPVQRSVIDLVRASWGLGARLLTELFVPADSGAPRETAEWFARFQRESASAEMAVRLLEAMYEVDVTPILPSIRAPTLVLHRRGDRAISERAGRELATGIAGARFVELAGRIHLAWMGDVDELLRAVAQFLGQPTPALAQEREPVRYEIVPRSFVGDSSDTQPRCRVGLAQIDVPFESFVPAGDGMVAMRAEAVPQVARQLLQTLERAAARRIELLLFPELALDARREELLSLLVEWARANGAYVVPGAFHVPEAHANVCRVIGPSGILWEQEKHIPAIFTVDGRRMTEGIRGSARRRLAIADTRFGRIAVAICRDFLDLDLRVALRNADPPVDIVLNPAFTPVTADFEAAHFEARRSLYAYCLFCNAARFGNSLISSPEKEHRRRRVARGREALLAKDVDLLALRAARRHWELVRGADARFIQSTR